MRRASIAGLALMMLVGIARAEPDAPRIRALLVGVGTYPLLEQALGTERYQREVALLGPPNDVALLRDVLVTRLGVADADVTVLVDPTDPVRAPTRRTIQRALARLGRDANAGDTVVVLLAGHGTQVPDLDGDEADGLDEVFLAADARPPKAGEPGVPGGLLDDELGVALDVVLARGARVVLVVDACHAGTMARGGDGATRTRRLEPETLGLARVARRPGAARDTRLVDAARPGLTALYAAGPDEKAAETRLPLGASDARPHGLLSWALAQELARSLGRATWRRTAARLVSSVVSLGVHHARPRVEGDLDVALRPEGKSLAPGSAAWPDGDAVIVDAGSLDGLGIGDVLELRRPPDVSRQPEGTFKPREAVVVSTGPLQSRAQLRDPSAPTSLPAGDPTSPSWFARVIVRAGRDVVRPLAVVDNEGRPRPRASLDAALRTALDDEGVRATFPPTDDPSEAAWLLVVDGPSVVLRSSSGLDAHDAPFLADAARLPSLLAHVARHERLLRLAGGGTLPSSAGLVVEGARDGRPLENGDVVRPGDRLRFDAHNEGETAVDVWAFLLDGAFGVTCVFPDATRSPRLARGARAPLVEGAVTDETLGTEHLLVVAVPAVPGALPADLRWLESAPAARATTARGGGAGDLGNALAAAAFGGPLPAVARGGTAGEGGLLLRTWTTAWEPLRAPRLDRIERGPTATVAAGQLTNTGPLDPIRAGAWTLARSPVAPHGYDLLVSESNDTTTVFLLAPTGVQGKTADEVHRLVADRTFTAAIALGYGPAGRVVHYDRDGDGVFDLRLNDLEGGPDAEERVDLVRAVPVTTQRISHPWLRLSLLDPTRHAPEARAHWLAVLRVLLLP